MSEVFEVIDRPNRSGNVPDKLIEALKNTVNSDKAVRLTLEKGANFINWQGKVRAELRKEGLRLRARYNKVANRVTCWAEPYSGVKGGADMSDTELGVEDVETDD